MSHPNRIILAVIIVGILSVWFLDARQREREEKAAWVQYRLGKNEYDYKREQLRIETQRQAMQDEKR